MVFPYMTHLLAAMLLGALIGAERQWRQRMAGLRTNALVATGAAVFILSAMSASPDSPGRIAAQIVSGIGFLGAGVIMRDGMNVRGLNTAATLWCSAGIGVLCGLGQFWNATAATLIILCANILLHDPGDAMLIKALLEHLFQHGIVLLATSNYPPEMLLPNPLYHDRFLPSIALIRAHLTVVALNGEEDYRVRHLSQDNAFCSGRMWVNPNAQQRQLYDLPSLPGEPVSLTVGYRTLLAAAASPALLHFTFTQLCQAATAVMDYLTLCESYAVWLLDEVPPLATVGPAAQQRFINVIDVLYEKQIRLLLVTRCDLETLVAGVELEDIQRTRSRLQQLPRAV